MKLQRLASLDKRKALLGPIQPDLTAQKQSQKKNFTDKSNVHTHNHIEHKHDYKPSKDGSPLPREDHFFRKAVDHFTHDYSPEGVITDPEHIRIKKQLEQPKKHADLETKGRISIDYLKQILDTNKVPESTLKLLVRFIEEKIDFRALTKMKNHIFDKFPSSRDITMEEWKQESHRFLHIYPDDVEDRLLEAIKSVSIRLDNSISQEEGHISKHKLIDLLDIYHFLPIKIKQDKNKSENVYFVLNSNTRGGFQTKEEILEKMKQDNDRMHLIKIMTLVAIKIEEKFHSIGKAFLFFDHDGDHKISKTEFYKGIEGLRVKLSKDDVEHVFEYMDHDEDGALNYKEFCGFVEEKRRNIDPFDHSPQSPSSPVRQQSLCKKTLISLQPTPYSNMKTFSGLQTTMDMYKSPGPSSFVASASLDDLESQATQMKIINNGQINKLRKGSLPSYIKKNKEFTYGIRSDLQSNSNIEPGKFHVLKGESQMSEIFHHSDNLKELLKMKIHQKINNISLKRNRDSLLHHIPHTKASELRSQSVLTSKTLNDYDRSLDLLKVNKSTQNETTFHDIEREKQKLARMILLPPIQRVQSLQKSLNNKSSIMLPDHVPTAKLVYDQNAPMTKSQITIPVLSSKILKKQ